MKIKSYLSDNRIITLISPVILWDTPLMKMAEIIEKYGHDTRIIADYLLVVAERERHIAIHEATMAANEAQSLEDARENIKSIH